MTSRSRVAALGKGTTIPGALRLAAKYHGDAETDNISWTEYQIKITGVSPKSIFFSLHFRRDDSNTIPSLQVAPFSDFLAEL